MLRNLSKTTNVITNLNGKVKFPEKFKGTIVEKWADYWKNLYIDYKQMLQDLRTDIQDNPKKAFIWGTGLATAYALAQNNPDELEFKDSLKRRQNEIVMVSDECRNPTSMEHLKFLETCYNQGVIHYKNFGLLSVMYVSELNDECDLYKSQCSYLQPSYLSLPNRIVDLGFMGRWWNIYIKTTNYDVK